MASNSVQSTPIVPLGGLYYLAMRQLYEEDCLKDIKQEVEAMFGAKLNRINNNSELLFVCKNSIPKSSHNLSFFNQIVPLITPKCKFHVTFEKELRNQVPVFRLREYVLNHCSSCIDPQEAIFLKHKRELSSLAQTFNKIVLVMKSRREQYTNPKRILQILCRQTGRESDFMFKGIVQEAYRRKLKKKFDNLIADAKKNCSKLFVFAEVNQESQIMEKQDEEVSLQLPSCSSEVESEKRQKSRTNKSLKIKSNKKIIQQSEKKEQDNKERGNKRTRRVYFNQECKNQGRKRRKLNQSEAEELTRNSMKRRSSSRINSITKIDLQKMVGTTSHNMMQSQCLSSAQKTNEKNEVKTEVKDDRMENQKGKNVLFCQRVLTAAKKRQLEDETPRHKIFIL